MNIFARFFILTTLLVAVALLTNCSGDSDSTDISESDVTAVADIAASDILPGQDIPAEDDVAQSSPALADFEDLSLDSESSWDGADGTGFFVSGQLSFLNLFNQEFMSWDGYSYSNITDNTTPGYDNQFSAIPGTGADGSATYAIAHDGTAYGAQAPTFKVEGDTPLTIAGAYVTNATYTYLSMAEGDDFAKQFGGDDGTEADWFLVSFTGFNVDGSETGTVEFYLADFRSEESAEDYIVSEWTYVDLSSLGEVSEVRAVLTSSDTGEWGMNTPANFAIDQIVALEL